MSLNASTIEFLLSKGLTGEDLLVVAQCMEQRRDPTNADRQARHRAKKRNAVTVTRDGFPNDIDILTPPTPPTNSNELASSDPEIEEVTEEHVIEAWNVMADEAGLPKARMTPERRKKLKTFIRRHRPDDITEAIWSIPGTPFLIGENDRGWKADLDFLLQPSKFTKIVEGTYRHG